MKELWPIISMGAMLIGGLGVLVWGVITGFRKRALIVNARLEDAQSELSKVMRLEANAWKQRYEGEHEEFSAYRKQTHESNEKNNSIILKLTAENSELRNKTDLSPILRFHQEQSAINGKVVASLDALLARITPV